MSLLNTICDENYESFNVKVRGTYTNHSASRILNSPTTGPVKTKKKSHDAVLSQFLEPLNKHICLNVILPSTNPYSATFPHQPHASPTYMHVHHKQHFKGGAAPSSIYRSV